MRSLPLFILPVSLFAQLGSDSWWQWQTPSAPAIAPGGGAVIYSLEWNDPKTDAAYSNLWTVSMHGENRPLTNGAYRDSSPAISPDGARVGWMSNRSGSKQIHVQWLDGRGGEAQVTRANPSPEAFAWSPDGTWIAYTARVPAEPEFQVKLPKPPDGAKWGTPATVVTRLRWRADQTPGQGVIPSGETHLFAIPAEGGAARRISPNGVSVRGAPGWTPDGKAVVAAAVKEPKADRELYASDIHLFPVEPGGAQSRQLTSMTGDESAPSVSPDGRTLAFLGFEDKGNAHHTTNLYAVPLAGGAARKLAPALDRNISNPLWRADSRALYALVEDAGVSHVHELTVEGGDRALTSGPTRYASAYASSETFRVTRDGRFAITRSSFSEPKDIVTFTAANPSEVVRLTHTNDALLAGNAPGAVEEIRYTSFDSKPVQGWVIKPPGFDASRKYPLILDIHGGPHAMYGVEFNWQMQVHAARGYVVLYTNPRGSTGYGEEFGNIIHARYPGDDYKDLMAGVDAVLARGYVDPARLYVTGGSGGGILTAWTVTQTNRFRAAVSQYPVINWVTQAGSSDIPLVTHRWMKATPWDNPSQYLERSPLFQAAKVKTPTMLLTGEEDWRTPIVQTEEFYAALKTLGVDTVMIRFPNEPHGIRGPHPSHWIAKVEYILGWFGQHAPPPAAPAK